MSSSALDLSNETQLRASRMCLLVGTSSPLLRKPLSGGGKWCRAGALAKMHLSLRHLHRSLARNKMLAMELQ